MNDEVASKIIAVEVDGGRMTARQLADALKEVIRRLEQSEAARYKKMPTGKQSLASLKKQKATLTNIEITENNIKSFEKYARKYGIDYALKKDKQNGRYYVFFKARDIDTMKAAFKEYTADVLKKKQQKQKPSLIHRLHKMMEKAIKEAAKAKNRSHQQTR